MKPVRVAQSTAFCPKFSKDVFLHTHTHTHTHLKIFLLLLFAAWLLWGSHPLTRLYAQNDSLVVPCSTACPEQWEGPIVYPGDSVWHGFSSLDTMFANHYGDCFWQIVVYTRLACGQYREVYVAEIRLARGCDSLMHDITTGTVTMQQVIDAMVKSLIWEDAATYGKILGIDTLDPNLLLCSNGGYTYYRVYKGNCGFWGPWEEYGNRRKSGDAEVTGISEEVQTIAVGRKPEWRYRRCSDACCIDGWHVCWVDLPDGNAPGEVSVEKIYSSQGQRCMNVHGPNFEICYYSCADSAAIGQWIAPEGEGAAEEITGVAEQRLQGWYYYDPRSQELRLYLHFAIPQPFTIALYDLQGKKVFEVEELMARQEQYIRLQLHDLPTGAYILRLHGADVEWQTLVRIW